MRFSGVKLKEQRIKKGLTLYGLSAELMKHDHLVTAQQIWRWEHGGQPSLDNFLALLQVLGCTVNDLVE